MIKNHKITENFDFFELTNTSHGALLEKNREYAAGLDDNLNLLGILLQDIRDGIGKPVTISSGVRCPELNKAVGGTADSRHQKGLAADIQVAGMTSQQVFDAIKGMNLPNLQKAIIEGVKGKNWVHIQCRTAADTKPTEFYATTDGKHYAKIA